MFHDRRPPVSHPPYHPRYHPRRCRFQARPAPQRSVLGPALNLLAGAALRYRSRFGVVAAPVWSLINSFAHGRLLAPPRPRRS
jgi:hypothetical protein